MISNKALPGLIIEHQLDAGQVLVRQEPQNYRQCQGKAETARNMINHAGLQVGKPPSC